MSRVVVVCAQHLGLLALTTASVTGSVGSTSPNISVAFCAGHCWALGGVGSAVALKPDFSLDFLPALYTLDKTTERSPKINYWGLDKSRDGAGAMGSDGHNVVLPKTEIASLLHLLGSEGLPEWAGCCVSLPRGQAEGCS